MDIKISSKFKNEIHLILDKKELMAIINAFDKAITLSDDQIDLWKELKDYVINLT